MKEIILIDDLSNKGWKSVLEKSVVKDSGQLRAFSDYESALKGISTKADLIFLDIRLSEEDHIKRNISEMSGFQLLRKTKEVFLSTNYSTPIILITASNKIWAVDEFKKYGVDAFYIKEHPDYGFSKESSRKNLEQLQSCFLSLIPRGEKRNEVWKRSKAIIERLNAHKYFNESSGYVNVKNRIVDKIKLGYASLFSEQKEIEKITLKTDDESLAFIIYWSILEEIVKGYSEKNNWAKHDKYSFSGKWKFRNNETFIHKEENTITVNPFWDSNIKKYVEKKIELTSNIDSNKYQTGFINLSEQVYALIYLFRIDVREAFKNLNDFRNKIDYIHSSIETIYEEPVISKENQRKTFDNIIKMLELINTILVYPK